MSLKLCVVRFVHLQPLEVLGKVCEVSGTDKQMLLLEWCYKVLAYVLLNNDAEELRRVLAFYETQIGVRLRYLIEAVAPPLLEEVVWLMGEATGDSGGRR